MRVLVVLDHPRRDSFCHAVAEAAMSGLAEAGHEAELADLHAERFDPRMTPADEPDWGAVGKVYSPAVLAEQARIERAEAIILVFPVWWWSMPATMKGWIDRVWNKDWAYGSVKLRHRKALAIGTAAGDADSFRKRGYDRAIATQIVTGILDYCGIADSRMEILYDVFAGPEDREAHLARARELGRTFLA